jgi:fimbrial isopeptide formation D2 family protein
VSLNKKCISRNTQKGEIMQLRKGLRGVAAAALSAATLLSLGISGVANADVNVPLTGSDAKGSITITNAVKDHTFKFVKLAEYQAAQAADATPASDLKNVAFTTTTNAAVAPLIQAATTAANGGTAVPGDPMNWVASNLTSSPTAPYSSNLRDFVSKLTAGANTSTLSDAADATEQAPATGNFTKELAPAGIYLIFDTTGNAGNAVNDGAASIPMLVATTVGAHNHLVDSNNQSIEIGKVQMKNDAHKLVKKLTAVGGNPVVANQQFNIGDVLTYTLTTKAPNFVGYDPATYYFHVQDYPSSGLQFQAGSSTITVGGTALTPAVTPTTGTTTAAPQIPYIDWNLTNKLSQDMYGKDIVITYQVKLTDGGQQTNSASMFVPSNPSVTPPNGNTVPDGPGHAPNGTSETPSTPADRDPNHPDIPTNPVINQFSVKFTHILKNTTTKVGGAAYNVSRIDGGASSPLKFVYDSASNTYTNMTGADSSTPGLRDNVDVPLNPTDSHGILNIKGLGAGTYKFDMTAASTDSTFPLKHTFEVTITSAGDFSNTADVWQLVTANSIQTRDNILGTLEVPDAATASQLPITGGAGIILVVALAVLAGGAVVVTSVMRRRALMTAKK